MWGVITSSDDTYSGGIGKSTNPSPGMRQTSSYNFLINNFWKSDSTFETWARRGSCKKWDNSRLRRNRQNRRSDQIENKAWKGEDREKQSRRWEIWLQTTSDMHRLCCCPFFQGCSHQTHDHSSGSSFTMIQNYLSIFPPLLCQLKSSLCREQLFLCQAPSEDTVQCTVYSVYSIHSVYCA